jgi:hypothetical protein
MLNRVAIVTAAVLRRSLGLSTLAKRPALHHPQPRGDRHEISATRSDAKSGVRKSKALPARRFESVRRRSQERFRTPPSLRISGIRFQWQFAIQG